jgi:hypothetical protein
MVPADGVPEMILHILIVTSERGGAFGAWAYSFTNEAEALERAAHYRGRGFPVELSTVRR